MKVIKRSGDVVPMKFDAVVARISKLTTGLSDTVDTTKVAQKVFSSMHDGISTQEIDSLSAEIAIGMITEDSDYESLATRIVASNIQKNSPKTFSAAMKGLYDHGILSEDTWETISLNKSELNSMINHTFDFRFGYFGLKTLEKGYLMKGETPQYLIMRVSVGIHGNNIEKVRETYEYMSNGYFIHATPTLFNAGTKKPQLSSCFLIAMKDDSLDGIYDTLKECAHISKWAGGIGLHVHNIRANKSIIKGTNGVSDGIVPMLRVFNATARYVNQAGRRKGSIAIYIEPWHADIMDFLELRLNQGDEESRTRDLFTALWIPDLFMKRVKAGGTWSLFCPNKAPGLSDVHSEEFDKLYMKYEAEGLANKTVQAIDVWSAILKSQTETGTPYMLYKDACNNKSNQKNLGTIKSSNLCVAPETKILTRQGYKRIDSIGDTAEIWNGREWSTVNIAKTSESSQLIRIKFSDGTHIECTKYHKFHLKIGYTKKKIIKEAKELVEGDRLIKWVPPEPIEFSREFKYAYTHGFFCGDGTYHSTYSGVKNIPGVSLYGSKKDLLEYLDVRSMSGKPDSSGRLNILLPRDLEQKFIVPFEYSVKSRLEWLAGICDSDGNIQKCPGNPNQKSICIASIHKQFLNDIQLMLHTLGASSVIVRLAGEGEKMLPDGKGGSKLYYCQQSWRLILSSISVGILIKNGFKTHRLDLENFVEPVRDTRQFVYVTSIEDCGRISETWCFNEPKRHTGIFNGVITGNCTEIIEWTDKDETAVCNLGSLALPKFVEDSKFNYEKLHEATRALTYNLNQVIDVNFYPVEEARKSNMRHRPIGLGVQGLADAFNLCGFAFDSKEAADMNIAIFETIYHAALTMSHELARKYGPYETFQGSPASQGILQFDMWDSPKFSGHYKNWDKLKEAIKRDGLRNSLLVAPMPTASTSQILGNNECIEPYTTNIYLRRTLAGEFVVVNKHLVKSLQNLKLWSKDMKNMMIKAGGSIQQIPGIPESVKKLYKTVWEIKQKVLIDMARDRGCFIDQSQSLNLFIENPTASKLSSMHMYAWEQGLKTGMYYLRSKAKSRPIQFTIEPECQMCSS